MILDFSSSGSHTPTTLVQAFYQVQTPEAHKPFSSGTHILRVHSSACTQTSVGAASSPTPVGPKAAPWVLPAQLSMEKHILCVIGGWSLQMFLHRSSITLVTKSSPHRPCRDGFLSLHSVSLHSQGFLLHGLLAHPATE